LLTVLIDSLSEDIPMYLRALTQSYVSTCTYTVLCMYMYLQSYVPLYMATVLHQMIFAAANNQLIQLYS